MKISIVSENGEIRIETIVNKEWLDECVFDVETAEYLIEITQTLDDMFVSNAMNGYGENCREDFKNAVIEIYK